MFYPYLVAAKTKYLNHSENIYALKAKLLLLCKCMQIASGVMRKKKVVKLPTHARSRIYVYWRPPRGSLLGLVATKRLHLRNVREIYIVSHNNTWHA